MTASCIALLCKLIPLITSRPTSVTVPSIMIHVLFAPHYNKLVMVLQATDAYHFFNSGQQKIQQGLLRDGYDLINEALNLLNNVYGAMHPEIAACARLLARLNYIMGDYAEVITKSWATTQR